MVELASLLGTVHDLSGYVRFYILSRYVNKKRVESRVPLPLMPIPKQRVCRGRRIYSSSSLFRNCLGCGFSNSVRRVVCRSCGYALKKRNRAKMSGSRRNGADAMSALDNQEESMETSVSSVHVFFIRLWLFR